MGSRGIQPAYCRPLSQHSCLPPNPFYLERGALGCTQVTKEGDDLEKMEEERKIMYRDSSWLFCGTSGRCRGERVLEVNLLPVIIQSKGLTDWGGWRDLLTTVRNYHNRSNKDYFSRLFCIAVAVPSGELSLLMPAALLIVSSSTNLLLLT